MYMFLTSRKHTYIILTPLKLHFYIVELVFTGVYIIFLIYRRGGSNEYPQSMFWAEIWKIFELLSKNVFKFLVIKFSIYLNRRFFVMKKTAHYKTDSGIPKN